MEQGSVRRARPHQTDQTAKLQLLAVQFRQAAKYNADSQSAMQPEHVSPAIYHSRPRSL